PDSSRLRYEHIFLRPVLAVSKDNRNSVQVFWRFTDGRTPDGLRIFAGGTNWHRRSVLSTWRGMDRSDGRDVIRRDQSALHQAVSHGDGRYSRDNLRGLGARLRFLVSKKSPKNLPRVERCFRERQSDSQTICHRICSYHHHCLVDPPDAARKWSAAFGLVAVRR